MSKYRNQLPQLGNDFFLTEGGMETSLVFHEGQDLPHFAAFTLMKTSEGRDVLRKYFVSYVELAKRLSMGLILDCTTWRCNPDWGDQLGYEPDELLEVNRESAQMLEEIRVQHETETSPIIISGCIGPRGDGYVPGQTMSAQQAEDYHFPQIESFANSNADMVSAITMNDVEEVIGISNAARQAKIPLVVSFTVETNGNLPTNQTLESAVEQVDEATSAYPIYYMINCAHPSHFQSVLTTGEEWVSRLRGLRANASRMSHAELDNAPELDCGDPRELGCEFAELKRKLPHLNVLGGCCGTDLRHIEQIATACNPLFLDET